MKERYLVTHMARSIAGQGHFRHFKSCGTLEQAQGEFESLGIDEDASDVEVFQLIEIGPGILQVARANRIKQERDDRLAEIEVEQTELQQEKASLLGAGGSVPRE